MAVDVLICNLTRLGDLLQNQPLISDLHEAGYSVGLLCQSNFAEALPLLRNLSQSWVMPGAKFLSALDNSWPLALSGLLDFCHKVRDEARAKYIINQTPLLPARLLCRLIAPDASIMGFGLDEYGYSVNEGIWSSFISVSAIQRINAPFNVADMFRRAASRLTGKKNGDYRLAPPPAEAKNWANNFTAMAPADAKGFVAFQPGASSDSRRWPVDHFRQLGQELWDKEKLLPVLFGAPNEIQLGEEYGKNAMHPFLNAIGKTTLMQAAALLKKCELLVTNDTGTMHLAAGQDVPILAFFLATAQPWDTGPLRPASCCLEPKLDCHPCSFNKNCLHHQCLTAISAQSAADLALDWLRTGDWKSGISDKVQRECRVWLTGRDQEGIGELTLLTDPGNEERNSWLPLLREFWRHLLDSIGNQRIEQEITPPQYAKFSIPKSTAENALPVLTQAVSILETIETCGEMALKSPQASKLLLKNCDRLQALLDSSPQLSTLAGFWHELRAHQASDLSVFLPAVGQFHTSCAQFAEFLANR